MSGRVKNHSQEIVYFRSSKNENENESSGTMNQVLHYEFLCELHSVKVLRFLRKFYLKYPGLMKKIIIFKLLLLMMMSKFKHTKLFARFKVHISVMFCRIDICRTVHRALFSSTQTEASPEARN